MYIGINFWYKQGYQIFYFPLDKYYDRAAKKSCQDLNCKNCLEVTNFGKTGGTYLLIQGVQTKSVMCWSYGTISYIVLFDWMDAFSKEEK